MYRSTTIHLRASLDFNKKITYGSPKRQDFLITRLNLGKSLIMKYLLGIAFSLLMGTSLAGQKVLLLEKFTNSKCGVCPGGAVLLQDIVDNNTNVVWVSHYKPWEHILNNDQSDQLWSDLGVYANPLLVVDRENNGGLFNSLSTWESIVSSELNEEQVATVEITNMYTNAFERTVDFDCNIGFLTDQDEAEYRITAMVVEDLVVGEPQSSYYNDTAGHPLEGLGDLIWNYQHRNVVRHIFDDAWGTPDVLPSQPNASDEFSHHYQFQIPEDFNIENMSIVCSITKYNPGDLTQIDVLQAAEFHLSEGIISSTEELEEITAIEIFPNPSSNYFDIKMGKKASQLTLLDSSGKIVKQENNPETNTRLYVDDLIPGFYIVRINIEGKVISKSVSIGR